MIADLRGLAPYGVTLTHSRAVPASPDASRSAALASPDASPTNIGAPVAIGTAREPLDLHDLQRGRDPQRSGEPQRGGEPQSGGDPQPGGDPQRCERQSERIASHQPTEAP